MDPALENEELLDQRDFLCRLARGLLGDEALAEDVVQEAELRALEHRPGANLRAWLATVTRRLALNARRGRVRRELHERAAARGEAVAGPDEVLERIDLQRSVLEAVRALDEPYRAAIWLRYYEDRPPAEIAARLGVPVATVKTRLRRALELLRERLDARSGGRGAWAAALVPLARAGQTGLTLGGVLAMKKAVAVLTVLVLLWLGWRAWSSEPGRVAGERLLPLAPALAAPAATEPPATAAPGVAARVAAASSGSASGREAAQAAASLHVHGVWGRDGTDAAGVGLVVVPLDDPRAELRTVRACTNAGGRAAFEGLAAGAFTVLDDREGKEQVELVAGQTTELELSIPVGVDVAGSVVDRDGGAVAGAEIWLTRARADAWLRGEIAARADAGGRFFLRSVGPRQSLGAFARGFAPAWLEPLSERAWPAEDPRVELTLVLDRAGAALDGRVLGPEGAPVPGALVALGGGGEGLAMRGDGRWGQTPSPRTVVTDALGRFRADWLEPGEMSVFALAEGFALGRADVTVEAGATGFVTVQLARGATIAGRVLDPGGQPVSGARVGVQKAGEVVGVAFSLPETTSAADGAFRLEYVPAGEVALLARHASDARLRARSTRFLAEGSTESWDIVLAEAPHISGRAVDGEGRPLAHWDLATHARSPGGTMGASGSLETDEEGRFVVLVPDPALAWTIELRQGGMVHDRVEDAHAGDEVVLVGRCADELGRVVGRFEDSGARAAAGERISARLIAEGNGLLLTPVELAAGRFAFEGVGPGRYHVRVQTAGSWLAESEPFDLVAGATVDVGVLASRPAGALVVEFVVPASVVLPDEGAYVGSATGSRALVHGDGEWRADGLDAGHSQLATYFPGLGMHIVGFEVEEGRETRLTVVLERGVERTLVFLPAPGVDCRTADVTVRGGTWGFSCSASGADRPELSLTLAPGSYEIEATASGGLAARGVLVVPDTTLEHDEVVFELR